MFAISGRGQWWAACKTQAFRKADLLQVDQRLMCCEGPVLNIRLGSKLAERFRQNERAGFRPRSLQSRYSALGRTRAVWAVAAKVADWFYDVVQLRTVLVATPPMS
jgi:hypothetical protein